MRKVAVERKGETNFFTSAMIKDCMKKVIAVNLHQVVQVDNEIEIKAYYAGHVLGAAMFHIKVGTQSLVYTGDYNMTPDRHLGAAWIDRCRPDLLISESTYATTIRDSKRCRERDFLKKVHECVNNGGKVLIPVFALGRAQELCILLETYWERMDLKVPIYFAAGLTEKLIMPGYCVQGTVGAQVLGGAKKIEIENRQTVEVKLSVEELGIDCFMPPNGETAVIKTTLPVRAVIDQGLLMKSKQ
ncbi:integrator complex subunit 11-like isoform X3 [Artemia franciscana]|uniref:integrator complex subunit 11-like isoform X3 n=1 Tax=Artemia franciscana TaxID=6661 RepID=UPI0032DB1C7A